MKQLFIMLCLILLSCATVNVFENVQPAADSTYGYSPENPIQMGYWDMQRSIQANLFFLSCLVTNEGNSLQWIWHASIDDPQHSPENIAIPRRFGPMSGLSAMGGLLDAYQVVPIGTTDTFTLYFDIYHKGPINAPIGLQFIQPE